MLTSSEKSLPVNFGPARRFPNCQLPTNCNISRTPTREALRQLITEGLLEELPGRGAVVARLEREDIVELYDLREALELHAVRTLASRANTPEDLASLQRVADELLQLINEIGPGECASAGRRPNAAF